MMKTDEGIARAGTVGVVTAPCRSTHHRGRGDESVLTRGGQLRSRPRFFGWPERFGGGSMIRLA
jgi:hypothetical protein